VRPVRIEAEGFTAFRKRVVVSFDDADLFAFVGPTGAGKSSLIDAMVFALYGKVPRYQDDRAVAPAINAQSAEARVRLDFEVEGEQYTAVRVVRRTKTGATTKEARLEHGDVVLAGDARELDDAVAKLLGLTFEQFTKTVVLPQGEFARFLHERPADRQDLLVRLLGLGVYGSMASLARERARAGTERVALLEGERTRIGPVDATTAAEHRARAAQLTDLADGLRETLEEITIFEQRIDAVRLQGEDLRVQQRAVLAVRVPSDVRDHQQQLDEAAGRASRAELDLLESRNAADASTMALATAPDELAMRDALRLWTRNDELVTTEHERRGALAALVEVAEACARELTAAAADAGRASAAFARAQDRSRAIALRHDLHLGDPCPVCEQIVAAVPAPIPDRELELARRDHQAAAAHHDATKAEGDRARRMSTRAEEDLERLSIELATVQDALVGQPSREDCAKALTEAASARATDAEARQQLQRAETAHRKAADAVRALDDRARMLRRELTAVRDTLARLAPPAPAERDLLEDWTTLVAWCGDTARELTSAIEALLMSHTELSGARDELRTVLRALCRTHGVDSEQPRLLEHLAQLASRANAEADAAAERFARVEAIVEHIARERAEQHVADDLAKLLGANAFQQWLLEEALDELVAGASVRLFGLSSGQFSLERDGKQLAVRDHRNADDLRPVKTLSGGETFLASLALALALADNVAALSATGAPRLESMFLDEGFGSLDPETLDVVAAAIEELGATGRMVGVVTHIRDLADRLPVRYEVTKLPDTSIVERVDR
jgi:exonuclease SbcC